MWATTLAVLSKRCWTKMATNCPMEQVGPANADDEGLFGPESDDLLGDVDLGLPDPSLLIVALMDWLRQATMRNAHMRCGRVR